MKCILMFCYNNFLHLVFVDHSKIISYSSAIYCNKLWVWNCALIFSYFMDKTRHYGSKCNLFCSNSTFNLWCFRNWITVIKIVYYFSWIVVFSSTILFMSILQMAQYHDRYICIHTIGFFTFTLLKKEKSSENTRWP